MKPHKIALLGLSDRGAAYLDAIRSDDRLQLMAMADHNPENRRRHMESSAVPIYEDYRLLVIECLRDGLELLVIALSPHQSTELIEQAVIRNTPVLLTTPFARQAEETQQVLKLYQEANCPLVVSSSWRYEPAFQKLEQCESLLGEVYCAHAFVNDSATSVGWRGDRPRAGGGALLYGGCDAIDLLTQVFGPVVSVYARCFSTTPLGTIRNYDTEDAATVALSFAHDRHALLSLTRGMTPPTWQVTLMGLNAHMEVKPNRLTLIPTDGGKSRYYRTSSRSCQAREIDALVTALRDPPPLKVSQLSRHLPIASAIEAAYLSAQTGQPEAPQILKL